MNSNITTEKQLNGTATLADWRAMVNDLLLKKAVGTPALATADEYYLLAKGSSEWKNVKRAAAGYEATRRAALALAKLNNIEIEDRFKG